MFSSSVAAISVALLVLAGGCGPQEAASVRAPTSASTPAAAGPVTGSERCWAAGDRTTVSEGGVTVTQYKKAPDMAIDPARRYDATIETNKGTFTAELFADDAPKTVNNFVCLARDGFYDNTPFHRIVQGFVIQGGDPTGTGRGGPGYQFNDEPVKKEYDRGTLAMANAGPNTNGSQFFVVLSDLRDRLPKNYTIFGNVTSGMDAVDAIAAVPTKPSAGGENSTPTEPVTIESVKIEEQ